MRSFQQRITPADRGKISVPTLKRSIVFPAIFLFSAHRAGSRSTSRHFPPKIKKKCQLQIERRRNISNLSFSYRFSPYRPIAERHNCAAPHPPIEGEFGNNVKIATFSPPLFLFSAHRAGSHFASRHFPPKIRKESYLLPIERKYRLHLFFLPK